MSLEPKKVLQNIGLKKAGIIAVLIVYSVLNIFLILHHEAWRDEAQAWCIATNLSVKEIFALMATEGHLMPWFLMLKVFYLLGGKFAWISLISLIVMSAAVLILLIGAPFSPLMKVLLVFSPLFFYYNAVISRCYCLAAFALVCTAYSRKIRDLKPILYGASVALILQTHVLVLPLGLALVVESFIELLVLKKSRDYKKILSVSIQLASLAVAFLELYQGNKPTQYQVTPESLLSNVDYNAIVIRLRSILDKVYVNRLVEVLALIILVTLIITVAYYFVGQRMRSCMAETIIVLTGITGYVSIVTLVRPCEHIQMALIFYEILLFGFWIILDKMDDEKVSFFSPVWLLALIVVISFFNEFVDIKFELADNFSNSKEMASNIVNAVPEGAIIYMSQTDTLTSVYAYVRDERKDIILWDVDIGTPFRCIFRGNNFDRELPLDGKDLLNKQAYWLTDHKCDDIDDLQFFLAADDDNKWDEFFYLYQLANESSD